VCKELIGRPVNCHAFRAALVTSFYSSGATQGQMNSLAAVMAHDPATARNFYFKIDAQKQALEVEGLMRQAYLKLDHAAASATAEPRVQGTTSPPRSTEPGSISAQQVEGSHHTDATATALVAAAAQTTPGPATSMYNVEPLSETIAHGQPIAGYPEHVQ
jgi:hypothetical protein